MGAFWVVAGLRHSCKSPLRGRGAGSSSTRWPCRQSAQGQPKLGGSAASCSWFRPVVSTLCSSMPSSWEGLSAPTPCHGSSEHRLGAVPVPRLVRSCRSKVPRGTAQRGFGGCARNQPRSVRDRPELQLMSPA